LHEFLNKNTQLMQEQVIAHLSRDPLLASIIPAIAFPDYGANNTDVYFGLLESITSQQLSVKAADTIFKRFLALFPNDYPTAELLVETPHENLRGVGLSNQKAQYMRNTATFFLEHQLFEKDWSDYSDAEVVQTLSSIKGVGKWTVEMILMFVLRRPDVFPIDDLGVRQAMIRLYKVESEGKAQYQQLTEIAEAWRPYRTYACRYLWRWKDS
jgi:DNA-3-methyladenine glycosylase II